MEHVRKLEKSLGDLFKGAPNLQKSTKKTLADIWPWVALVLGTLQLLALGASGAYIILLSL